MREETIQRFMEIGKITGKETTREQAMALARISERGNAILDSLNDRLERDHKKHIQILTGAKKGEDGQIHVIYKFLFLDAPKYWEYVEGLVADYCESLAEIKRTKTTLVVMA